VLITTALPFPCLPCDSAIVLKDAGKNEQVGPVTVNSGLVIRLLRMSVDALMGLHNSIPRPDRFLSALVLVQARSDTGFG
jgi:hypothetical protein